MNYTILIPAYNPDDKFTAFVDVLKEAGESVLVVDDGSKEECQPLFAYAEEQGLKVVHHDGNKGKGQALRTGFKAIQDDEVLGKCDYVITADCDGQHTLESIHKVAAAAEENPGAMIIGGRFQDEEDVPLRSRIGNGLTRLVFKLATGLSIHDTQTGLRAVPASLLDQMAVLKGDRYEYEMNMLLYLKEWSVPYKEIPIATIYYDNNAGSHYNTFRDSWLIFKQIFKFISSSVISFVVDYVLYLIFAAVITKCFPGVKDICVPIAYATARVISGIVNYLLNSRFVFKAKGKRTFVGYFILWFIILCLGAGGSYLIRDLLGLSKFLCKLLVDIPLFLLSYFVQREIIFKKKA